jgi:hypothetical protein
MTYEAAHNAIRGRFSTQWGSTTVVAWPNVAFTPPTDAAWVRFLIQDIDAAQVSYGDPLNNNDRYRHIGRVVIQVFTLKGQGDKEARELADTAAGIFRKWSDAGSGVLFRLAPFVRDIPIDEPKWFQINVECPFLRDSYF